MSFREKYRSKLRIAHEELCWNWTGWKNPKGYGRLVCNGKHWFVHRLAYTIHIGRDLKAEEIVMHKCNNPSCCNPAHLQLGTIQENNAQKLAEGRWYLGPKMGKKRKLHEELVRQIKLRLAMGHGTYNIASEFGISDQTVRDIRNGRTWTKVKLPPKNKEEFDVFGD